MDRRPEMQFFQKVGKGIGVSALVALLLFSALPVSAAQPNRALAANPAAVLQEIDAANLPDVPDAVAAEMRGGQIFVLYGYAAQLAYWCGSWCQKTWDTIDAFLTTGDFFYASLPKGTPVYSGYGQSTPAYYKK